MIFWWSSDFSFHFNCPIWNGEKYPNFQGGPSPIKLKKLLNFHFFLLSKFNFVEISSKVGSLTFRMANKILLLLFFFWYLFICFFDFQLPDIGGSNVGNQYLNCVEEHMDIYFYNKDHKESFFFYFLFFNFLIVLDIFKFFLKFWIGNFKFFKII